MARFSNYSPSDFADFALRSTPFFVDLYLTFLILFCCLVLYGSVFGLGQLSLFMQVFYL